MRRVLALAGWGQPHDALAAALPDATHFAYAHHESIESAVNAIAKEAESHTALVGWSLGGQLLARAVAQGKAKPEQLVLIGVPFRFVSDMPGGEGMLRFQYDKFLENYAKNPRRTMDKAWELVAYNDARADEVKRHLARQDKEPMFDYDWHSWLKQLDGYSFEGTDFSRFPPTLLVHGDKDAVVSHTQAYRFEQALPHSRLAIWEGCGHAPHWHNPEGLRALIESHADVR